MSRTVCGGETDAEERVWGRLRKRPWRRAGLLLGALLVASVAPATCRPQAPREIVSNQAPLQGQVASPSLMPGGLWVVIAPQGTTGRERPDARSRATHVFARGQILQADVGRGGADEVLLNPKDGRGQRWMRARTAGGQALDCYVRASTRVLAPLLKR